MKKTMWKRLGAIVAAVAMLLSIAACDGGNDDKGGETYTDGKVFSEPTEISIALSSHPTTPHKDDWIFWKYMQEATGAKLDILAIPLDDFFTKVNLMMTSQDTLPDLLHITQKKMVDQSANQGALMAFDDYEELLPDYKAFMESLPDNDREEILAMRRTADGKIYNAPAYGTQTVNNTRGWLYRKDIFEKYNLDVPTTYDEVYEVAKELKALYPDSYPICFRHGFSQIRNMGAQWRPYHSFDIYYDFNEEVWKYGAFEDTTREMVAWLAKMVKEGLAPPNIVNISTKEWEELLASDRGFITLDYMVRIDHFNNLMASTNPTYEMAYMAPPAANDLDLHKMCKVSVDLSGYAVCNTGDEKRIENAFKLVNWMYTDEAAELLSWGKEGETFYVNDNGNRRFIIEEEGATPNSLYGVAAFGLYQRMKSDAFEASYTEKQVAACREAYQYLEEYINPMWWLSFTDDESQTVTDIDVALGTYCEEWIGKFIIGQEPLSKWDEFVEGGKKFKVDQMISIYDAAYKRAIGK